MEFTKIINLDAQKLPQHIGIIMDGNGRWAKQQGVMDRIFGHTSAITAVREATEGCSELKIKFLTLFTFSTENWNRPKSEVDGLMSLLVNTITKEMPMFMENNVCFRVLGNQEALPKNCQVQLNEAIERTKTNNGLTLNIALSYSGKWDILQATQAISKKVQAGLITPEQISEEIFEEHLSTKNIPTPDLIIRTGGDFRISNFMLWQAAYSEFYIFDSLLWPDFTKKHLIEAIQNFQNRERRFGKTSEQISKNKDLFPK